MSSQESKDDTPPGESEEPIVAKVVDVGAETSNSEADSATAEIAKDDLAEMGGDVFGLTGATQQGESAIDDSIRVGSPFAVDPNPIAGTSIRRRRAKPEAFYDVGPMRYTAMGAVSAATLVLGFAGAAAWWFPGGGTIIASLGCALSIFGLYSNRKLAASSCLVLHLLLFMISYSRAITT